MGLDANIILGYKQPQIMSGDERQANAYKLKALAAEDQINQAKLQDYADKQAQAQALKAWQQANPKATAKDYLGAGYIDQAKDVAGVETSTLANDAASLKLAHDKANYFASTTGAVMQNPTYENAVGAVKDAAAKGYISSEQAQAELAKIPQDPIGVKAWATNHVVSSLEAAKQLPQLGQVDSGSKVNLTARSPIDGSTTITDTFDKTLTPQQVSENAVKPFIVGADGSLTPNKPVQDYEIKKARAGSGAPPSGYMIDPADPTKLKPISGGPADQQTKLKPIPATITQAINTNQQSLSKIDRAIQLLEGTDIKLGDVTLKGDKEATGWKGLVPPTVLNRIDPKGTDARATIADIGSLILHDRSGAAVTASESPRLMPFIPTATDDNATALKKLKMLKLNAQLEADNLSGQYNEDTGYKSSKPLSVSTKPKAPPSAETKVIGGITYHKVNGKWLQE